MRISHIFNHYFETTRATFYNWDFDKLDTIKDALLKNRETAKENIKKQNLDRLVCVKDLTDNSVHRISQREAEKRMNNSDGLLVFVPKLEWKNYDSEKQDYECHLETGDVFKP
jgi:hypothetical protein